MHVYEVTFSHDCNSQMSKHYTASSPGNALKQVQFEMNQGGILFDKQDGTSIYYPVAKIASISLKVITI